LGTATSAKTCKGPLGPLGTVAVAAGPPGLCVGVAVAVGDALGLDVALPGMKTVTLAVGLLGGVVEGDAVLVGVDEGRSGVSVGVALLVGEGLEVLVAVGDAVGLPLGVPLGLTDDVADRLGVAVKDGMPGVSVLVRLLLALPVGLTVALGVEL
jgi:hypothetical protein